MPAFNQLFSIWRTSFAPLRLPNLRIYLGGQAVSLIGTWLQTTAQSLLVYQLSHGSAAALGVVVMATAFPMLVFSLWIGAFTARFDRRKLLIATQIGEMLLAFILAWLAQSGQAQLWHVYLLAFCLGTLESIVFPTQQAFIADLVGPGEVRQAVTLNAMIINISRAAGPAIAGFIAGQYGIAVTFWLNGLSFLAVIFSLLVIKTIRSQSQVKHQEVTASLMDGFRFIGRNPQVRGVIIAVALLNAFGLSVYAIAPAVVGGSAANTGYLLAAAGAGSLVSVFFVMPFVNNIRHMGVVLSGGLIWMGLCLLLLSRSTWFPFTLFTIFLAGLATTVVWVGSLGLLQVLAPVNMRPRMLGMFSIVSFGVQPLAALALGSLADHISTPTAILITSVILTVLASSMLVQSSWRNWEMQPVGSTSAGAVIVEAQAELSHV